MKHIYRESANFIESYVVNFVVNEPTNLNEMVAAIDMEAILPRARLHYTRHYLMSGIGSLVKPVAMEEWCHFPPKSPQQVIIYWKIYSTFPWGKYESKEIKWLL